MENAFSSVRWNPRLDKVAVTVKAPSRVAVGEYKTQERTVGYRFNWAEFNYESAIEYLSQLGYKDSKLSTLRSGDLMFTLPHFVKPTIEHQIAPGVTRLAYSTKTKIAATPFQTTHDYSIRKPGLLYREDV